MKPKLCRQCGNYMNEETDTFWCSYCDYEEQKTFKERWDFDD